MSDKALKDLSSIVPELYFDVIARLVPGLLILFTTVAGNRLSSSIGGIAIALILAYVVGFFCDVFSDAVMGLCEYLFFKLFKKDKAISCQSISDQISRLENQKRNVMLKLFAEFVMLRTFLLFLLVQLFLIAIDKTSIFYFTSFDFYKRVKYPGGITAILFAFVLLCFLRMRYTIIRRLNNTCHIAGDLSQP